MPYPSQTFNTFDDLLAYINALWITNGNQEITGLIGNNVVNGLLTFIRESPLNYQRAKVSSTAILYAATQPVNIFTVTPPISVSFGDNIYNEYTFVNATGHDIPLLAGMSYYDVNLNQITYIPSNQIVNISKAQNGLWIQTNNLATSATFYEEEDFTVQAGGTMVPGQITYTISVAKIKINSVNIFVDGSRLFPNVTDQFSYSIVYNANNVVITFLNTVLSPTNQGVQNQQKITINYAKVLF